MLLEPVEPIPDEMARLRVEAGGGLVEQEQLGFVDKRAGNRQPAFHPARKKLHPIPGSVSQLNEIKELLGSAPSLVAGDPKVARVGEQVFIDEQLGVQRVGLWDDAQPRADSRTIPGWVLAQHTQGPARRRRDAPDHPHGRRFTGAVRAEEAERLAALDIEVDRVNGNEVRESLCQATGMDKRVCSGC